MDLKHSDPRGFVVDIEERFLHSFEIFLFTAATWHSDPSGFVVNIEGRFLHSSTYCGLLLVVVAVLRSLWSQIVSCRVSKKHQLQILPSGRSPYLLIKIVSNIPCLKETSLEYLSYLSELCHPA